MTADDVKGYRDAGRVRFTADHVDVLLSEVKALRAGKDMLFRILQNIALYPFLAYTVQVDGEDKETVPLEQALHLRKMARDAIGFKEGVHDPDRADT